MVSIPSPVEAGAPGNMILMGEYAVLDGAPAVLMTLKHRLRVTLSAAERLAVFSDRFGAHEAGATPVPPHILLIGNVLRRCGVGDDLRIDIVSGIPPVYGFGSSAALVAALVKAVWAREGRAPDFTEMFTAGHAAILDTHGRGSGADLAAALADHPFVLFDPLGKTAAPFAMPFAVQAIYTGYKTPTPEVLRQIRAEVPADRWQAVTARMKDCAARFIAAPSFAAVREYQGYMDELGVTCPLCRRAIDAFGATAAKISGSGRGDCIVGFSDAPVDVAVAPPLEFLPQEALRP